MSVGWRWWVGMAVCEVCSEQGAWWFRRDGRVVRGEEDDTWGQGDVGPECQWGGSRRCGGREVLLGAKEMAVRIGTMGFHCLFWQVISVVLSGRRR